MKLSHGVVVGVSEEETGDQTSPKPASQKRVLSVAAVVALVGFLGWQAIKQPELPDFVPSGQPIQMPAEPVAEVSLAEFEGILVGLQGKPVVVNIWGSWCPPCRTEMPLLQSVADNYESRAVVLGVSSRDNRASAQEFLKSAKITYPNVADRSGEIARALDINTFPTTFIFDADGELIARVNGGISEQRIAGLLEDVLS